MSLKSKYLHIIELGFEYLTQTEKNYLLINLLEKLDNLGYRVSLATLSKISKKQHVGSASLEKVAKGFQAIIERELCLRYNEVTMQYEQIIGCKPITINEDKYKSQSNSNDDRTSNKPQESQNNSGDIQRNNTKNIQSLIIKGDINGAIKALLKYTYSTMYYTDSIILSSRQNRLEDKINRGIISVEDADLQQTKITNSILNIATKLE